MLQAPVFVFRVGGKGEGLSAYPKQTPFYQKKKKKKKTLISEESHMRLK